LAVPPRKLFDAPHLPTTRLIRDGGDGAVPEFDHTKAAATARRLFKCALPDDGTIGPIETVKLRHVSFSSGAPDVCPAAASDVGAFVATARRLSDRRVYGPGSSVAIVFNADGIAVDRVARAAWRTFAASKEYWTTIPAYDARILASASKGLPPGVVLPDEAPELAYYDDGENEPTPVYRFKLVIPHPGGPKPQHDDVRVRYVSAVDPPADVESTLVKSPVSAAPKILSNIATVPQIDFGLYVIEGRTDPHWTSDGDTFSAVLATKFTQAQRYVSEPGLLVPPQKGYFVDGVDVAIVEGHGVYWNVATYDGVPYNYVALANGKGYGARLKHLILRSCSAVPAPVDLSCADLDRWYSPWMIVFNGMHSVVGFHSLMLTYDGVGETYADSIVSGKTALLDGWFAAVASASDYVGARPAYGMASAVIVCGSESETVDDVVKKPDAAPGCLSIYWTEVVP
ncbi:MAG TPA: DUF6345 domain-containing protein, partial [Pyrinomonadaceae bacterium]|nr:DUF6345 domain-containing protein [Pyrinomonadaceae bacterium]